MKKKETAFQKGLDSSKKEMLHIDYFQYQNKRFDTLNTPVFLDLH